MTIDEAETALKVCGWHIEPYEQYWMAKHEDSPARTGPYGYVKANIIKQVWVEQFGDKLVLS